MQLRKINYGLMMMAVGLLTLSLIPNVMAEEKTVLILEGNVDPTCIETACHDPDPIYIQTGDTVIWVNQDIPAHTIVSGSPYEGTNGTFDSGLILPEKTYEYTFVREGEYEYYCVLHPWATGKVIVTGDDFPEPQEQIEEREDKDIDVSEIIDEIENKTSTEEIEITETEDKRTVKELGLIGQKVGDGRTYSMSYIATGNIEKSFVSTDENYIMFTFQTPSPEGDEIFMKLHQDMIVNPNFVEVNGVPLNEYNYVKQNQFNVLMFKAPSETWEVKVYGTKVVPEFGHIAMAILVMGVITAVVMSRKMQIKMP